MPLAPLAQSERAQFMQYDRLLRPPPCRLREPTCLECTPCAHEPAASHRSPLMYNLEATRAWRDAPAAVRTMLITGGLKPR